MKFMRPEKPVIYHYTNTNSIEDINVLVFGYQRCTSANFTKGVKTKPHYVIHFVLSGCGSLTVGEKTFAVKSKDIFFLPMDVPYHYEPDQQNPWEYIWIEFSGIKAKNLCRDTQLSADNSVYNTSDERIEELFWSLLDCPEHPLALEFHAVAHLMRLVSLLIEQKKPAMQFLSKKSILINNTQKYIIDNLDNSELSLNKISGHMYVNPSYLSRAFKEFTGINISKYISLMRIQKARELLESDQYSIKEIAYLVGYTNPQYFSSEFKKYTGSAPARYIGHV